MIEDNSASLTKGNALLGLQFLSDFGDQITAALLALCLLDITKSTGKVGSVYLITTVGYVLFTFAGGILGDRMNRRNILFLSDIGRGLAVLLLILAVNEKSITMVYATSFLLSVLGSFHRPVRLTIWAQSIPSGYLERYNSFSELSVQASTVLGPLIASFFILNSWTSMGFAMNAMTFFVCAITFVKIVSSKSEASICPQNKKRDILVGFKLIARQADMAKYVYYDAIQMIGFGAFNATFLVLAQRDFGWNKADYSYHLSIIAAFTVLGALMGATSYVAKINPITKLITCAFISAAALWIALQIRLFPVSSIFMGICDGLTVLTMAVTRTKVQLIAKNVYPNFLSSIIAARYIIIKAATLFGTGACLLIDDFISLEATLAIFVIPIALSSVPFFIGTKKAIAIKTMS